MKDKISVKMITKKLLTPILKFVLIHFMLGPTDIKSTKGIRKGKINYMMKNVLRFGILMAGIILTLLKPLTLPLILWIGKTGNDKPSLLGSLLALLGAWAIR